jgi:hypothetical protein
MYEALDSMSCAEKEKKILFAKLLKSFQSFHFASVPSSTSPSTLFFLSMLFSVSVTAAVFVLFSP